MNETEHILKESIISQTTVFLESANEFYPFGVKIDNEMNALPVGVYDERDYLPSIDVIEILQKELSNSIKNKECILVGIGIDVTINQENQKGENIKKNALMIKMSCDGENWEEEYYGYEINKNTVSWG